MIPSCTASKIADAVMCPNPVTIIGAGIAGLTLARCLRRRGIDALILDKMNSPPNYSYAITLYARSYRPLLKILEMDESMFRTCVAVDPSATTSGTEILRVHRAKLESLLREGLDVRFKYELIGVDISSRPINLSFRHRDQTLETDFVVAADGIHSQMRHLLLPNVAATVLPFVVFNGKRYTKEAEYKDLYSPFLRNGTLLETRHKDTLLRISVDERTNDRTCLNYTYSRPAREDDKLHNPSRSTTGASDIPEAFYNEVNELADLENPFRDAFEVHKLKSDRVLHWLMRTTMADLDDLRRLANKHIVFLGDAVHAQPILGGRGANSAIIDGIELSEHITANEISSIEEFYGARYEGWKREVAASEQTLRTMHSPVEAVSSRSDRRWAL